MEIQHDDIAKALNRIEQYYRRTLSYYAANDPEASLWMARKTAEAMCRQIFERNVSPNAEKLTLDKFIELLNKHNALPRYIEIPLRTIQSYGNYGTHDQGEDTEIITKWYVQPCLHALASIIEWYFSTYHHQERVEFPQQLLMSTHPIQHESKNISESKKSASPSRFGGKTVKQLVWEAVQELIQGDEDHIFSPKEVIEMIHKTYPTCNKTTIRCQLISDCVNHTSRHHYPGGKDRYWRVKKGTFRLFIPERDKTE